MKKYVIEREIPGLGSFDDAQLRAAAKTSNGVLAKMAPKVQWVQSYVAADKMFCVYLADSEDSVRKHAELGGFPANTITEIKTTIDPLTENGTAR